MPQATVFYAIGDIHGECVRLRELYDAITDFHTAMHASDQMHIVALGDYVDRGPDSQGVLDFLMELQAAHPCAVTCLQGNHEQMMLDAASGETEAASFWSRNGGYETLGSYGIDDARDLPPDHLKWLRSLPRLFQPDDTNLIFVHAGLHPVYFPNESEDIYIWTRSRRFFDTAFWESPELTGCKVIHGHTPTDDYEPEVSPDGRRINVDTGATMGGKLTAVVLAGDHKPIFLST